MTRRRVGCWIAAAAPVAVVVICVLALAMQDATWRVHRTRTMTASPDRLHEILTDVRAFAACCAPREARSPSAGVAFSPSTSGSGAWLEWGPIHGRQRGTIASVEPSRVTMHYDVGGHGSRQIVEWRSAGASGTEVTWTLEGDKSGFVQRLLWPFVGLEARLGASIEEALAGLERSAR